MNDGNRLLMSDSLKGVVPELEDDLLRQMEDALIFASFHLVCGEKSEALTAMLLGCALEDSVIKVDMRLETPEAYQWFSSFVSNQWTCPLLLLNHGDSIIELRGPFNVKCPRLFDVDRKNNTSSIGIDLFRNGNVPI